MELTAAENTAAWLTASCQNNKNQTIPECWFPFHLLPSLPRWYFVCLTHVNQCMEAMWRLLQHSCLINNTHSCTLLPPSVTLNPLVHLLIKPSFMYSSFLSFNVFSAEGLGCSGVVFLAQHGLTFTNNKTKCISW